MDGMNRRGFALRRLAYLAAVVIVALLMLRWRFRPLIVDAHPLAKGEVVAEVFGTGTLEAKTRAALGPLVSGRIEEILVDLGARVKKDQILVRLESSDLRRQVEATAAALDGARAAVERVKAELGKARAIEKTTRSTYQRDLALRSSKIMAASEGEKSEERLAVADGEVQRLVAAVAEAEADQRSIGATLAYHEARLSYAQIKAPFDGLVITRLRDPGDVVVPGTSVLEVIALDVLWIRAWIDEVALQSLRPDQPARVVFRSNPEENFPGSVDRLGRQVDRETREFVVDVRVKSLPGNWAVGQRAEVYIEVDRREGVTVLPQGCLDRRGGHVGVWAIEKGALRWKVVETGLVGRESCEVLSGLDAGAVVVKPDRDTRPYLAEGQRVVLR